METHMSTSAGALIKNVGGSLGRHCMPIGVHVGSEIVGHGGTQIGVPVTDFHRTVHFQNFCRIVS